MVVQDEGKERPFLSASTGYLLKTVKKLAGKKQQSNHRLCCNPQHANFMIVRLFQNDMSMDQKRASISGFWHDLYSVWLLLPRNAPTIILCDERTTVGDLKAKSLAKLSVSSYYFRS
jgi:hypothetical protein